MNEVIVITGGRSGIGLATAAALRKRNCRVYELSRRNVKHENGVLHLSADVTDEAAVKAAIDTVIAREGRVDMLICNAGFGISGAAEFAENEAAKHLLDVNLFGAVNAVKAVLPRMRAQHSGRILCIKLYCCTGSHPVPGVVLRVQGGGSRLCISIAGGGFYLRNPGCVHPSGGHPFRLYRKQGEVLRRR